MNFEENKDLFIRGALNEEETLKFLDSLDKAQKKEIEEAMELSAAFQIKKAESNLKKIQQYESKKTKVVAFRAWAAAAASLLLLAVFIWISKDSGAEKLANQHFSPYPNIAQPTMRNASEAAKDPGFLAYDAKDYHSALNAFNNKDSELDTIAFYKVNCLLALKEPQQALALLEMLNQKESTAFILPRKWLEALIMLMNKEYDQAIIALNQYFASGNAIEKQKAKNLIKEIEQLRP